MMKTVKIQETKQYKRFTRYEYNRLVNEKRLKKLEQSILKHPELAYVFPIIVDSKYNIYDGQRRFTIWKKHNMPIVFRMEDLPNGESIIDVNAAPIVWSLEEIFMSRATRYPFSAQAKLLPFLEEFRKLRSPSVSKTIRPYTIMAETFTTLYKINIATCMKVEQHDLNNAKLFIPEFVDTLYQLGKPPGVKTVVLARALLKLHDDEYSLQRVRRLGSLREVDMKNTVEGVMLMIQKLMKL